jgi:outer membrane protein TolC
MLKEKVLKKIKYIVIAFSLVVNTSPRLYSQDKVSAFNRLSPDQVLTIMRKFHPVIRQANIQVEISENDILNSRGSFDPFLTGKMGAKNLKQEDYYQAKELGLEIPTWYGIDFEAGIANMTGQRLDNAITTGNTSFVGVNIPLLKNLVYDKRRGYLEQAKIMNRLSIHEQRKIVNDVMLEAMKAYWDWVKAYETYKILDDLVDNNVARLKFVNQSIGYGERPAIDSVEAKTQLLSFQIEKENRWTDFLNAGNELSIYLWKENETPYSLPPSVIPNENWDKKFRSAQPNLNYEALMNEGVSSHPEIKMYEEQLNFYRVQRKMYFQDLLPKLDLNYRMLSNTGPQNFSVNEVRPFTENYQYSLKLDIPLRLSEGRANYRSSKLKINYGELALQQKAQSVSLKIKTYFNSYLNFEKLNRLQFENYENYSTMVRAEETRFKNGESNLFTINAREIKALEALEKMIELKTKYFKSIYEVKWSAGMLK